MNVIAKTSHSSLFIPVEKGKLKGLQAVNNKVLKIETRDLIFLIKTKWQNL